MHCVLQNGKINSIFEKRVTKCMNISDSNYTSMKSRPNGVQYDTFPHPDGRAGFENFYSIDPSSGKIKTSQIGGADRVFMFSATGWSLLVKKIHSSFGSGGDVILFEMGQYYGSSIALGIKKQGADYEGTIHELIQRTAFSGWGKVSVSGDLPRGKHLSLRLDNCVFCVGRKSAIPSCNFFRGMLSAIAQVLYGRSFKVNEEQCMASGSQFCRFALEEDPYSVYRIEPVIDI